MNSRRGSTFSPISVRNISSALKASSSRTCSIVRFAGSSVVSHSSSASISPRPLKPVLVPAAQHHAVERQTVGAGAVQERRQVQPAPLQDDEGVLQLAQHLHQLL